MSLLEKAGTMNSGDIPKDNIGSSLIESTWASGLSDIVANAVEIPLDNIMEDGPLKDIPVLSYIIKTYNIYKNIRDRLFLKKIAEFLYGTTSITTEKKDAFKQKMIKDPEFQKKVGEKLILLLERQEDFDKSFILGKVFAGYISDKINYETFLNLAAVIDRSFINDLKNLKTYYSTFNSIDEDTGQSLYRSGLVNLKNAIRNLDFSEFTDIGYKNNDKTREPAGYTSTSYVPSEIGKTLLLLLNDHNP